MDRLKIAFALIGLMIMVLLSGCSGKTKQEGNFKQYGGDKPFTIGVIYGTPDVNSPVLRNAISNALTKISGEFDVEYKIFDPKDFVNNQEAFTYLAENKYDLIIAEGAKMNADVQKIAPKYSDVKFALFGSGATATTVNSGNVHTVVFNQEEGAFLAGTLAASLSKTGSVGFVGGSETASHTLEDGFTKGVQLVNSYDGKAIKTIIAYAGVTEAASNDTQRGKQLASNMFWSGADVVFSGESKLAMGVAQAASETKSIALSGDQTHLTNYPWTVWGALIQKQDAVVYTVIKSAVTGKFDGRATSYGVKSGALDIGMGPSVLPEVKSRILTIKDLLRTNKIDLNQLKVNSANVVKLNEIPIDMNKAPSGTANDLQQTPPKQQTQQSTQQPTQQSTQQSSTQQTTKQPPQQTTQQPTQ